MSHTKKTNSIFRDFQTWRLYTQQERKEFAEKLTTLFVQYGSPEEYEIACNLVEDLCQE